MPSRRRSRRSTEVAKTDQPPRPIPHPAPASLRLAPQQSSPFAHELLLGRGSHLPGAASRLPVTRWLRRVCGTSGTRLRVAGRQWLRYDRCGTPVTSPDPARGTLRTRRVATRHQAASARASRASLSRRETDPFTFGASEADLGLGGVMRDRCLTVGAEQGVVEPHPGVEAVAGRSAAAGARADEVGVFG